MNNKLLSIDQSKTCTAWCIFEDENLENLTGFGCIKTTKDDGNLFERVDKISSEIESLYKRNIIPHACREGLSFGGVGNATRDLAYLVGAIESKCGREFLEVPPKSVKKFATGSGNADKQQMIDALPEKVRSRFLEEGYKKSTGLADLADAYFIGQYFINSLNKGE